MMVGEQDLIEKKQALRSKWTFWYFERNNDRTWEESLETVCPFSTVEDFWTVYLHIKCVSELRSDSSYFMFKGDIKPMWEDPANRKGGRWLLQFDRRWRSNLDNNWLEVLLCIVSNTFGEDGVDVCGAALDIRGRKDKISVWTADCTNDYRIINIGKKIKQQLNLNKQITMIYESHADTAVKTGSSAKPLFQL